MMEHAYSKKDQDVLMTVGAQDGAKRDREETSSTADVAIIGYALPKKPATSIPPEDDNMPSIIETPSSVSTESYWSDASSEDDKRDANKMIRRPNSESSRKPPILTPIQENSAPINVRVRANISLTKIEDQMRQKAADAYSLHLAELHKIASNSGDETSRRELRIALSLAEDYKIQTTEYKILKRQTTLFEYFPNAVIKPTEDTTTPMEDTVETTNSLASPQEQVGRKYMSMLAGCEGPCPTLSSLNAEYMLQYVKSECHSRQKYLLRINVLVDSTLVYFYELGKGPIDTFFLGFFLPDVIKWLRCQFATYFPVVYYHWWY
jgi:hypothetical protein